MGGFLLGALLLLAVFTVGRRMTRDMPPGLTGSRAGQAVRQGVRRGNDAADAIWAKARSEDWLKRRDARRAARQGRTPLRSHVASGTRRTAAWYGRRVQERSNRPPGRAGRLRTAGRRLLIPAGAAAVTGATVTDLGSRRQQQARRPPAAGPPPAAGGSPSASAPMPAPPAPAASNGRTPMTTPTATGPAADLFTAVQQIIGHARSGGLQAKHRAIKALAEGHDFLSQAMQEFATHMAEPSQDYPASVWEPLAAVAGHDKAAAMAAADSDAALTALENMSVRELAGSPIRAPHHDELNSDA